jgi:hypothetical protein
MRRSRFSDQQIALALQQVEHGIDSPRGPSKRKTEASRAAPGGSRPSVEAGCQ